MNNTQRALLLLAVGLIFGSPATFGQQDASASVELQAADLPGSNGIDGYKPLWVSMATTLTQSQVRWWRTNIEYRRESGSPQTKVEGVPFNLAVGINAMPSLDLSLNYFQSVKFTAKGRAGDSFSYTKRKLMETGNRSRDTYRFSSDKKITIYQYSGYGLDILWAGNLNKLRLYGGLALVSIDVKSDIYQQETLSPVLIKLGAGYFIGNFFVYLNISDYDSLGVRYYFQP